MTYLSHDRTFLNHRPRFNSTPLVYASFDSSAAFDYDAFAKDYPLFVSLTSFSQPIAINLSTKNRRFEMEDMKSKPKRQKQHPRTSKARKSS